MASAQLVLDDATQKRLDSWWKAHHAHVGSMTIVIVREPAVAGSDGQPVQQATYEYRCVPCSDAITFTAVEAVLGWNFFSYTDVSVERWVTPPTEEPPSTE